MPAEPQQLICASGHHVTVQPWCKKQPRRCPAYVLGKPCAQPLEKYDGRRHNRKGAAA